MKKIGLILVIILVLGLSVVVLTACKGQTGEVNLSFVLNEEKTEYAVRSKIGYANGIAPEIPEKYKKKPVTKVDSGGFRGATAFISITIPETITEIGHEAFNNCYSLTIIFKSTTPPVQDSSFGGNLHGGVKALVVPAAAVDAYKAAWPDYASKIHSDALINNDVYLVSADGLLISFFGDGTQMAVPSSVKKTGARAFVNNELISEISFHAEVDSINIDGLDGCKMLTKININAENTAYSSHDGILFNKAKTTVLLIPDSLSGAITLPEGITQTSFEDKDYFSGTKISSISFPTGFTRIVGEFSGKKGFLQDCTELTSVTLANNLDYIGKNAFGGCSKLTSINIPASVTKIEENAFFGCSKLTINVPFAESEKPDGWVENWHGGCAVNWNA